MTITTDVPTKTVTITFEPLEWKLLARDPGALRNQLVTWLKEQARAFFAEDQRLVAAKINTLTPAQLEDVKTQLGL